MSSRITIKSIANELGISFSTVSKALNQDPAISAQTRELVERKANEMGYQPNLMARGLRNKSTRCVAIILNGLNNTVNTYMIQTLSAFLQRYDYATIIFDSQVDLQTEHKNILTALSRSPDCLIISPVSRDDPNLKLLCGMENKTIFLDGPENADICNITIDHFAAGKLSAETLLQNGHSNTLIFTGDDSYPSSHEFTAGIREAYRESGIHLNDCQIIRCSSSFTAGHDAFVDYYLRNPGTCRQPLGIIAFCDWIAFGVYYAISELGLSIPDDVSIIGYDDNELCLLANPPLSTIHYPKEEVSKLCCDMMISLMSSNTLPVCKYTMHPHIVERLSVLKRQ